MTIWEDSITSKLPTQNSEEPYFYFIDEELGLCFLRVSTWSPFRLQFYFNGHNWLASQLRKLLAAGNRRYLQFISNLEDNKVGMEKLNWVTQSISENRRSYKGFNFFEEEDQLIFEAIASGEFNISGFQNKHLRGKLPGKTSGQISRILKKLHIHGLIKKVGRTYKYYLTQLGQQLIIMGLKLKELYIIPNLAVTH